MTRVLVGSYSIPSEWTGTPYGHGAGITSARLEGGSLVPEEGARWEVNPSFLVADPAAGLLWAITEPEHGGEVLAFAADGTGLPAGEPARFATGRDAPCHLTVTPGLVLVSHYHGGAVSVIGRGPDGLPSAVLDIVEPPAAGEGWDRSAEPARAHSTLWLGDGRFLVADCGRDTVLLYRWDAGRQATVLLDALVLQPGTGPRHLARHPLSGRVLVSDQNLGAATVVAVEEARLRHVQTLVTSGVGRARVVPSEIAVHPAGELAVMANRVDDSLTVFRIVPDGRLAEAASVGAGGVNPRHFAFTPDGARLVVAHQESDELAVFAVADGRLIHESSARVATPTCVAFWAA
ncbi:MAG: beta-propeller fold lactonase family protein [Protaetiibacter sp.]